MGWTCGLNGVYELPEYPPQNKIKTLLKKFEVYPSMPFAEDSLSLGVTTCKVGMWSWRAHTFRIRRAHTILQCLRDTPNGGRT